MKSYLTTHLAVALHALVMLVIVVASAWYIDMTQSAVETKLISRIETSLVQIQSLAETTDRNGADALTERIISDCPRRTEFENLLNGLNTATRRDLISAQQLFESCGAFFAERKALMVSKLEREYRMLDEDLTLLATLRDLTPDEGSYRKWDDIVRLEGERSALLNEQTTIQADIIELLIEGNGGVRIQELVQQAQDVGQSLTVVDAQIDALRTNITS
jgi:hypothetical protein